MNEDFNDSLAIDDRLRQWSVRQDVRIKMKRNTIIIIFCMLILSSCYTPVKRMVYSPPVNEVISLPYTLEVIPRMQMVENNAEFMMAKILGPKSNNAETAKIHIRVSYQQGFHGVMSDISGNLLIEITEIGSGKELLSVDTQTMIPVGMLTNIVDDPDLIYNGMSACFSKVSKSINIFAKNYNSKLEVEDALLVADQIEINSSKKPEFVDNEPQTENANGVNWALVIGVSKYEDTKIPKLRYASQDAVSFYEWLTMPNGGKYAIENTKLLLDQNATASNIRVAMFDWLSNALEEDTVTIYFAGHGSPDSPDSQDNLFLLPYDTRYDKISSTGFPMWDVETALKRYIKSKRVIIIADACHSGGVGLSFDIARRSGRGIEVNGITQSLGDLSQSGEGICVISASDEKQLSQEGKQWGGGHGVFTYYLLKGLNGEADYNLDNNVTIGEISSFLSQEVRRATQNKQRPTIAGRFDPSLIINN